MGTSSRGGVEIIVNPASLVGLLTLGRCPPHGGLLLGVGGHTPGRWRVFFYFWLFFRSYSADPRHKPESQRKTTPIKVIPDFFWQQSHLGNKVISAGVVQHPRDMLTTRDGAVIHLRPVNSRGSGVQAPVRPHVLSAEGAQASPS